MTAIKLSIVIGVQHAQDNLTDIMRTLLPRTHPLVEFLLCHTSADPDVPLLAGNEGHVRTLRCRQGSLIPHLWREGILAARGERVATTTAHCIPAPDWVQALMAADLEKIAALGGTIENDRRADAKACAIFLLRYAADGRTVILSSHLLGEVEQTCTHVVVMHEGRRLAAGPVAEIMGEAGALMVGTPEPEHAVAVLRAMDGVEGAEAHPDGVLVHHDGVPPSTVVAALVAAGVPVERVGPSRRLEDAFLALIAAPGNGGGVPGDGLARPPGSDLVGSQGSTP
jgi:hypothetical protein